MDAAALNRLLDDLAQSIPQWRVELDKSVPIMPAYDGDDLPDAVRWLLHSFDELERHIPGTRGGSLVAAVKLLFAFHQLDRESLRMPFHQRHVAGRVRQQAHKFVKPLRGHLYEQLENVETYFAAAEVS